MCLSQLRFVFKLFGDYWANGGMLGITVWGRPLRLDGEDDERQVPLDLDCR